MTPHIFASAACEGFWPEITARVKDKGNPMNTADMAGGFTAYVASGAVDDYAGKDLQIKMDRDKLQSFSASIGLLYSNSFGRSET